MLTDIIRDFLMKANENQLRLAAKVLDSLLITPMVDICVENGFSLREAVLYIVYQIEVRDGKDPKQRILRSFIETLLEHTVDEND